MVLNNGDFATPLFSVIAYKPFGTPVTTTGTSRATYASEIRDTPTGLYYLSARHYDPGLGRFYELDTESVSASNPQTSNQICLNRIGEGLGCSQPALAEVDAFQNYGDREFEECEERIIGD
ncbi:MAG: hypothetical protein LUO79_06420 [Methanomassiliicoccales archaeon]|nr:hypothetical protein [Methanomassiliicoccales archaeon]